MTPHLLAILLAFLGAAPEQSPAGAAPEQAAPDENPASFENADQLLDALERADRHIQTFRSGITYDRRMTLQGDIQIRYGDLYFHAPDDDAENLRTFGIHFDKLLFDDKIHDEQQTWVFDGEWLVEKRTKDKQYIARQIAAPGEGIDPLRLGEGPLPIPIGQKKQDILARYEARLAPIDEGFDPDDMTSIGYLVYARDMQAQQIVLTPREERRGADDFRRIRLWYARHDDATLIPVLSRTLDRKGDEVFVQLYDIEINEPLPAGVTEIDPPPNAEEKGWHVQIERRITRENNESPRAQGEEVSQ